MDYRCAALGYELDFCFVQPYRVRQLNIGSQHTERVQPCDVAQPSLLEVHHHFDFRLCAVSVDMAAPRSGCSCGGHHGLVRTPPGDERSQADGDAAVARTVPGLPEWFDSFQYRLDRFCKWRVIVAVGPTPGQLKPNT